MQVHPNWLRYCLLGPRDPEQRVRNKQEPPHHMPAKVEIPEALSAFLYMRAHDGLLRPWEAEKSIDNENSER
jgi:hypothetical protein